MMLIAGQGIVLFSENRLAEFRRSHIGFIFQSYALLSNLTMGKCRVTWCLWA